MLFYDSIFDSHNLHFKPLVVNMDIHENLPPNLVISVEDEVGNGPNVVLVEFSDVVPGISNLRRPRSLSGRLSVGRQL